ncbi:flagellar motor protein MotB [Cognatishimia sp. F0-27]|uniref:flagellar motor protein MotB n=1 Tax=Cognatishimia sp. F0-27 TaxID=2816855 RepID=UPI001D0C3099|nr:flagellar motor protein MotB [Cognatishimia sp. F0-27]MCC1492392.1 chemotaxis protein MotB [Cognatishimia sp. F0-27]
MSADSNVAPIIIKKKKIVQGDGHHGGAWKVAYADFVTAMMAFFMLMWLLNATTEKQRKGIADYFSPTIAISRVSGGGNGVLGGETVFAQDELTRMGTGSSGYVEQLAIDELGNNDPVTIDPVTENLLQSADMLSLETVEERLVGRSGESLIEDNIMRHVISEVTDEGLKVTLRETADQRFFDETGQPEPILMQLAQRIVAASEDMDHGVAIEAHTASFPLVMARDPSWDVSNQRAHDFRTLLVAEGFESDRVARVTAHADREPEYDNPLDPRNNRIEVIFLTRG